MKKNYRKRIFNLLSIMALLFILFSSSVKGQGIGVDIVLLMDNSGSVEDSEWTSMTATSKAIIDKVLACNPNNRIAIVHYGTGMTSSGDNYAGANNANIYIETNFTNNATTAKNYVRRSNIVGYADNASESVKVLDNALSGIVNAHTLSAQKTLTRSPGNRMVVFHFTDGERGFFSDDASSLIAMDELGKSNPDFYKVYNGFKTKFNASFIVLRANSESVGYEDHAIASSAAIASVGGSYAVTSIGAADGSVSPIPKKETNPTDPEGQNTVPPTRFRRITANGDFSFTSAQIDEVVNNICRSCGPSVSVTPTSQTVCTDTPVAPIVATASGFGALSYQWYRNIANSNSGGTLIPGAISSSYTPPNTAVGTLYYYVVVTDVACDNKAISIQSVVIVNAAGTCFTGCYKPAKKTTPAIIVPTLVGITSLEKPTTVWPKVRNSGWLVLEAKTKGLVLNRLSTTEITSMNTKIPNVLVKGMTVYNTSLNCIYVNIDGTATGWKCMNTQTCQ